MMIKQSSKEENAQAVTANLIDLLKVKVSKKSIEHIKTHVDYPSLSSISTYLSDWNIENMAVNIPASRLQEIPYPAIAHLHKNDGHFVVLTELLNDKIKYIDPEIGWVKEHVKEFEEKWTGVALLVQKTDESGEESYTLKRTAEIFNFARNSFVGLLFLLLIVTAAIVSPIVFLPLLMLKFIGLLFCVLLLQRQFGGSNRYLSAICQSGKNSDCDAVIHSPGSILFGVIHLSELGLLYFVGGWIALSISAFSNYNSFILIPLFNGLALVYTLFSVYYQLRVIKKWCPLCLGVLLVFWLEVFVFSFNLNVNSFNRSSFLIEFISFCLPVMFWISVRKQFINSFRLPSLEIKMNHILKNTKVFHALLEQQTTVRPGGFAHQISFGIARAPIVLTIVSSPTCEPCASAHLIVNDLLKRFTNELKVNQIFRLNAYHDESISTRMVKHLYAISLEQSEEKVSKALSDWYLKNGKDNFEQWVETHSVVGVPDSVLINSIMEKETNWCLENGISTTPAIFIMDKKMPDEYSLPFLRFHIKELAMDKLRGLVGPN